MGKIDRFNVKYVVIKLVSRKIHTYYGSDIWKEYPSLDTLHWTKIHGTQGGNTNAQDDINYLTSY
jgi:hypothetical protein